MAKVLSLAPGPQLMQTLADVAYMLSDGGRDPIFGRDVVALSTRFDPRAVRAALFWSIARGDLREDPEVPGAYAVGDKLLEMARAGGFDEAS